MTIRDMCDFIAKEFQSRNVRIRNLATGRTIPNAAGEYKGEDIYNWSSHGELMHVWEWWALVNSDEWKGVTRG